jgi:epoxyqueuosine reductase
MKGRESVRRSGTGPGEREKRIKLLARQVGFSIVGIAGLEPHEKSNRVYERWLANGMDGEMSYLHRHQEKRRDPRSLLPGARSAICVGLNYYQDNEKTQPNQNRSDGRGVFSIYVHGEDYHEKMDDMLADLEARLRSSFPAIKATRCVDVKPISDRAMAIRSGIGWLGKNTSVISPEYGSWVFLGELLTDLDLEPDVPLETLCAGCTKCIDVCPTGALDEPFLLDANKCISYLTVEKRGEIAADLQPKIGMNVYGCDTCQSVCPFNAVATQSSVFDRSRRSPLVDMSIDDLARISDETFRTATRHSAIRRCKPEGIRRNAAIVRENLSRSPSPRSEEKPKK